ncbi:MAG TPA: hypothetical protein V6D14_04370 [Coleofasciculaceae cyanobacterium]|jgi:hypothetical protein
MPGGHASHKGTSPKPNTNAPGIIDIPDDAIEGPHDIVTQDSTSTRPDEAPENAAATQRPTDPKEQE